MQWKLQQDRQSDRRFQSPDGGRPARMPGAPIISVRVIVVILGLVACADAVLWILNSHHGGEARATVARNNSKSGCVSAVSQNA
jgi:hypothetical protein